MITTRRYVLLSAVTLFGAVFSATADLHPILEVESGYFFGATEKGKWIKAEKAVKSVNDGTVYRVYGLTEQLGETKGGKPAAIEDVCMETMSVSLSPKPEAGVIALAAPWNALPRKPRVADPTQQVYIDAVRNFLEARGIRDPKVRITRILRMDLDGDGEDEVLINATNYFTKDGDVPMDTPARGSYSIVLLRRVVAGKVQTEFVAGELYLKHESNTPNVYETPAVLDLNGDGKLEVIVHSHYYEGAETTIYDCSGGKCKAVLSVACGV